VFDVEQHVRQLGHAGIVAVPTPPVKAAPRPARRRDRHAAATGTPPRPARRPPARAMRHVRRDWQPAQPIAIFGVPTLRGPHRGGRMRRAATTILLALLVAAPAAARPLTRSYLAFAGGADVIFAHTGGDVIDSPGKGMGELGVGYQLSKSWLLEGTYGFMGRWEQEAYVPIFEPTPDVDRVFRVTLNPMFLRARWAHGGARIGYFKPELSAGLGFVQVSRLLRNPPPFPPAETSQLVWSAELGASALMIFSQTFMGWLGVRGRFTEREGIANDVGHLDGVSILIGFRAFLPSPRDVAEPDEPPDDPNKPKEPDKDRGQ
jgi:hypothetical protein